MNPESLVVTKSQITADLACLGVCPGDRLEVHSSLRALGWVEGGAAAVIDALMECVGSGGVLLMSAYPVTPALPLTPEEIARGMTWKVRILPDPHEKSGLGAVVDEFCKRPDTCLGSGLHRVCAWGQDAAWYARQGYRPLVENGGRVLLLGVGIDRCSCMHLVEGEVPLPPEISQMFHVPQDLLRDYPPDQWSIGYGSSPASPWQKVWDAALARGLVQQGRVGAAHSFLFQAAPVLEIYEDWLRNDPYGLYGLPTPPEP
jgi:aminoglycoside 3-N-acetyltransferase